MRRNLAGWRGPLPGRRVWWLGRVMRCCLHDADDDDGDEDGDGRCADGDGGCAGFVVVAAVDADGAWPGTG